MRKIIISAGFLGLAGVILGALGAHALHPALMDHGGVEAWQTAVLYQLAHAIGVIAVAALSEDNLAVAWRRRAGASWILGILLFSGSLFVLALGGPRWLGPITPLGGLALLAGWIFVLLGALKSSRQDS